MSSASEVQCQAMKLPRRSRLKLASALLDSVAPAVRPDKILGEAARRDAEIATGKVTPLGEARILGRCCRLPQTGMSSTLSFHPLVQKDLNEIIAYYELEATLEFAARFETEFCAALASIKAQPRHFPLYLNQRHFRRCIIRNFPHLILYRETLLNRPRSAIHNP